MYTVLTEVAAKAICGIKFLLEGMGQLREESGSKDG